MLKRKLISLLLALTLLAALASCGNGNSGGSAPAADVDLKAFYESLLVTDPESEDYFNPDVPVEGDALATAFPGLEDIATKQLVIYQPMMSAVVCEIALVEVTDRADVPAVLDILQARVKYMVGDEENPGAAWYPASIEGWQNNSRIVSNGSYIMLIAYEKCDDIVARFDVLFE